MPAGAVAVLALTHDPAFTELSRLLLKGGEQTWGLAIQRLEDWASWRVQADGTRQNVKPATECMRSFLMQRVHPRIKINPRMK